MVRSRCNRGPAFLRGIIAEPLLTRLSMPSATVRHYAR
jgi:hypothetical protein